MRQLLKCFLLLASLAFVPLPSHASKKVALVIGNDQYENVPSLSKAVSDARTISSALTRTGFEVIQAHDLSRRATNQKLHELVSRVEPGDVALIYYAGHGIEIKGQNYLLPVDIPTADPGQEGFVKAESVSLESILVRLREKKTGLNIVILDACRDNPFKRPNSRGVGQARGLAAVAPPRGTFILYSADAGEAALDALNEGDVNDNSVFTRVLAPMIEGSESSLVDIARDVRKRVRELARTVNHEQTPAYYDAVVGDFFFSSVSAEDNDKSGNASTSFVPGGALELEFWRSVENSQNIDYLESYIQQYPEGKFLFLAKAKIQLLEQEQTKLEDQIGALKGETRPDKQYTNSMCEEHFNANRLTTGAGGNAYDCYNEVLKQNPKDIEALSGLAMIEGRYADWANKYIRENNINKANVNIRKLKKINPDNPAVNELQARLEAAKQRQTGSGVPSNKRASQVLDIYRISTEKGIVTDTRTGLQWMRCTLGQQWRAGTCSGTPNEYNQYQAIKAQNEANEQKLMGFSDWRVPTKKELLTLVYCSSGEPELWKKEDWKCSGEYTKPTINLSAFPGTPLKGFWTSTSYLHLVNAVWAVLFHNGSAGYYRRGGSGGVVRLVRDG